METETTTKKKGSNTFGIIAVVIAVLSIFTPKIFLTLVLIALAVFLILGFVKDRSSVPSFIALGIGVLLLVVLARAEKKGSDIYNVEYSVTCRDCDVSYTNETGGNDNENKIDRSWTKEVKVKGDQFLFLHAQNHDNSDPITTTISVNGKLFKTQTSNGDYSIASVSGKAKDIGVE